MEFSRTLYVEIAHDISRPCRNYFEKKKEVIRQNQPRKIMWGFQGYWFLASEFPRVVTKFFEIYKDGIGFIFSGSSEGKVANLEISEVCSKKCYLNHLFWVFLEELT